jgi:hypothetical protein
MSEKNYSRSTESYNKDTKRTTTTSTRKVESGIPIIIGILPSAADVDGIHGLGLSDEIYPNYPMAYSNLTERTAE